MNFKYLALAALVLVIGCVKEDRSGCPCLLAIDMSEAAGERITSDIILTVADSGTENSRVIPGNSVADEYIYRVNKGDVNVKAIEGMDKCKIEYGRAYVPEGDEFDSIFACSHTVQATGETCRDKIHLDKQFAIIDVHVLEDDKTGQLDIKIKCEWSGFLTDSLQPVEGNYSCSFHPIDDKLFRVKVPRQGTGSIELEISEAPEHSATMDIGRQIRESGYDWNKASLDDITVMLDYADFTATILINDWEKGSEKEETI